jgi:adenine phosphoribosyltransferase
MDPVKALIRDVPDFPRPGILFKDITPVLGHAAALEAVIDGMAGVARIHAPTRVLGIESRGFLFGTPVATKLGLPFAPVRKPGKLPHQTFRVEYELEYGTDSLEIHVDAVERGDRVIIIDDVLATGGTAEAACRLVESQGAEVAAVVVLIELTALGGAARLSPRAVHSLLRY